MKKLFVSLIAISSLAFSAGAQENKSYDKKEKGKRTEKMHKEHFKDEMNLTEAQKTQLKTSREEMKNKAMAIRNNNSLTQEQKKSQIDALRAEHKLKMESILTPEQKLKMQNSSKMRGKGFGKRNRSEKGDHGDRMKEMHSKLGLTTEQSEKLKALQETRKAQVEAVKNNSSLSEEAKKQQIEAIKKDTKAKRNAILTPDQQNKMKEMKKNRKGRHSKGKVA